MVILLLYVAARAPTLDRRARNELAAQFRFSEFPLDRAPGRTQLRTIRAVHPDFEGIAAWISSVGAAVAINDIDRDGLANDICYVDVRTNDIIVTPAPGTPKRYATFILFADGLPFDTGTVAPMGCLPGDFNGDGTVDLIAYYWGRTPVLFEATQVKAAPPLSAAAFRAREIVPAAHERWYTNALTSADVDGDGDLDLVVGNYFPDDAGVLDVHSNAPVHMQRSMSRAANGGGIRILLARPSSSPTDMAFDELAELPEVATTGWTLAVGAADLDGDLLPEIYIANDFGKDHLLHNQTHSGRPAFAVVRGNRMLTTPRSKVLGGDSFKGMGVDFGQVNADTDLDIAVSNIATEFALLESHFLFVSTGDRTAWQRGTAPFRDESERLGVSRSGWGWDTRFGDFNNDGSLELIQATGFVRGDKNRWPELQELAMGNDELLANPKAWPRFRAGDDLSGAQRNAFFVRAADGRFYDLAPMIGLNRTYPSRGIATADVDGDGDLDFAIANQWADSHLYLNELNEETRSLTLRVARDVASTSDDVRILSGNAVATPLVGVRAEITTADGRVLVGTSDGGSGHSGKKSSEIHFGLGNADDSTKVRLTLRWRDGRGIHSYSTELTPGRYTVLLPSLQVQP